MYTDKLARNKKIIKAVIAELEKIEDDRFVKLWNIYSKSSLGIRDAKKEGQLIDRKKELHYMDGYSYEDCLYALAQDICIWYGGLYKKKKYQDGPILPASIVNLVAEYKDDDPDEILSSVFASVI